MKTIVKVCLAERAKRKTKFFWRAIEKSHSASLTVSPIARMKRSMAQVTQCVVCLQPVKKGWGQLNHKKFCMGAPARNKGSTTKTTDIRVNTEDDNNHKQHEKEIDGHDEAQDSGLDFGCKMAPYEGVALLNDDTITAEPITKDRLGQKTRAILKFLDTAEKGEGCSREKAQSWLDYHHAEGSPNSRLMPKDIRTLWKHVAKV
jgi:hypothetical protein